MNVLRPHYASLGRPWLKAMRDVLTGPGLLGDGLKPSVVTAFYKMS